MSYKHPNCMISDRFRFNRRHSLTFNRDGFLVIPSLLSEHALSYLQSEVAAIYAGKTSAVHDEWVMNLHQRLSPERNWMWRLATEPKILDIIELMLGPDIVLFSTQIATKRPNDGKRVPLHQDGERCRTVWIPLDDANSTTGALRVIPGGHKKGRLRFKKVESPADVAQFEFFHQYHLYACDVTDGKRGECDVTDVHNTRVVEVPAGGMEIHHPSLPHGSDPNYSSDSWRRVIIMRYQPASEPLAGGSLTDWRTGERFEHVNYLVRGQHPLVGEHRGVTQTTPQGSFSVHDKAFIARSPLPE
eukprot:m.143000 g.143000  ORF g.143000 m.143000 type:complete len:302 (+) comp17682_c0_seq5:405-1310(+)